MNTLVYMAKTILIAGILFSYYLFFLRNRRFHQYNRFYLLSIPVLSMVLPFLQAQLPGTVKTNPVITGFLNGMAHTQWLPVFVVTAHSSWTSFFDPATIGLIAYSLVVLILLTRFFVNITPVIQLVRKKDLPGKNGSIVNCPGRSGVFFSFFNTIFLDETIDLETSEGQQVLRHERYHIQQKHSVDIIFLELVNIFFWFNPFFYWVRREIRVIHEFAADQFAFHGYNRHDYAELLVRQSTGNPSPFVHTFFTHPIKRRIIMILHSKTARIGYFGRLLAIPIVYLVSCAFSTGAKEPHSNHGGISAQLFNDTLPSEKMASVDPMNIESMEVRKDQNLVIIKLKNSDSLIYVKLSELKSNDSLNEASKQNDPVFTKVEHPATYPGGYEAWVLYLNKNLHYPDSAVDQEKQGDVIVQFIVNKDGTLSNIKVIQKVIKSLDDEALRMVINSGKWQPAVQNGHVVRAYVNQPIRFRLEAQ